MFCVELRDSFLNQTRPYLTAPVFVPDLCATEVTWLGLRLFRSFAKGTISALQTQELCGDMLERVSGAALQNELGQPAWLKRATDLLHGCFRESLTLDGIAQQVQIHPIHLSRVFRKRYRCTIAEYMNRLRVQFVCRALQAGWADLGGLAADAGFSDQSHMGRVFKLITGQTPGQFPQFPSFRSLHRLGSPVPPRCLFCSIRPTSDQANFSPNTVRWEDGMRRIFVLGTLFAVIAVLAIERRSSLAAGSALPVDGAQFTAEGKLARPANYRKWVFLSSGYGMSYSQKASDDPDHLMFTNVFVPPADYDYFLQHGSWPDKTMFVLEIYGSQSKGSINQRGHFQTEFMGLDVGSERRLALSGQVGILRLRQYPAVSEPISPPKMTAGSVTIRTRGRAFFCAVLSAVAIHRQGKEDHQGRREPS
jgi:AraC-like DNA-binding protein